MFWMRGSSSFTAELCVHSVLSRQVMGRPLNECPLCLTMPRDANLLHTLSFFIFFFVLWRDSCSKHMESQSRESNCIGLQEIFFLMRRDKTKLIRLMWHLSFKDSLSSLTNPGSEVAPAFYLKTLLLHRFKDLRVLSPSSGFLDLASSSGSFSSQSSLIEESTATGRQDQWSFITQLDCLIISGTTTSFWSPW